jgi:hypothetical protein
MIILKEAGLSTKALPLSHAGSAHLQTCVFIKYPKAKLCRHEIPNEYPWITGHTLEVYLIRIHEYEILYSASGDIRGIYVSTTKVEDKSVTYMLIAFNKYLLETNRIQ